MEESKSLLFSAASDSASFLAQCSSLARSSVRLARYTTWWCSVSSSSSRSTWYRLMAGNRVLSPFCVRDLALARIHLKSPSGPVMVLMDWMRRMEEDSRGLWLLFLLKARLEKQKQHSWYTRGLKETMLFLMVGSQCVLHHSFTRWQCCGSV